MKLFLFNNDEKLIGTVSPLEGIQNEEINKIRTIECTTVYSELIEKASYIGHKDYSDNRIFHLYKIDHVTKTSTTDVKIVGVHTFFDDMESDGYIKDFRPTNRELVGVLTTILDGSRWQLGSVNVQRNYTGNFYYVTRKEAISKLIEATQIEIKPRLEFSRGKITGRYLDVFTRLGARNGKVFVHGRDLLTVSEKKSQGAIYTAVVGRGKGEETDTGGYGRRITFKDVVWTKSRGNAVDKPAGQEYVEIPAMTELYGFEKGTKPRIKIVEFQDETDKEKLLRLSYEWLEKNSRMQVEYSAKVLNVGNLELGDTVGIFNPKIGIKYETRVFKVKRNLVDNKLTEFGIGDKVTTSPFSRTIELAKEMKNFQDDTVYWLDKIRERLSDKLINEDGYNYDLKADNEYKVPAGYYSFDKPIDQNPTKVVYMGAGKIAIANSKKPTGEWNWKTFLDGTGATLDLINTGVLRAGRIQSADGSSYWDLDSGEFHLEQSAINEAIKTAVSGKVNEVIGEVKKNLPTKEELKGKSSYLHKKYSDFEDGRNMDNNSNRKYIGIYTGDKATAPTSASEYSWTKIKGEDGARGRDGERGRDGNNGRDGRNGTDGHSLTASLWFTGGYVNNVINDVKLNLKVFYDGREIRDFRSNITYKGGNFSSWQTKENPTVTSYNVIDYTFWSNGEKDGSTLFALATVTYNGLQAVADARLDNVPDVRLLNETIKKYKTFESTIDGFTSVVGEIDTKILSSAYFKNNLNVEDVEKTGNDLYFNAKENLVANEYYTILADLDNVPANQQTYIYGASDGGDKKIIQNGLNYWVVKCPDNRGSVNLYPLGANTKVKNVKIYKGDFRVKEDKENLYKGEIRADTEGGPWLNLKLKRNLKSTQILTIKFDATGFNVGDKWDISYRQGYKASNLAQRFKEKDNTLTFNLTTTDEIFKFLAKDIIIFQYSNARKTPTLSNIRIYEENIELGYAKSEEVSKLESSIKQTKDTIDLKVSKDDVIASINASVETTGTGRNQGVVKINADKVDISGVLSAYTGIIGGFRIGANPNDGGGLWLTGQTNFDCGMNPGVNVGSNGAQFWAAWGSNWTNPGPNAWWVNAQGVMTCKATPVFNSGVHVPHGVVHYNNGTYTYSPNIKKIYMEKGNGKTWIKYYIGTVGPEDDEIAQYWNYVTMSASDKRYKSNIKPTEVNGLEIINNLKCYDYDIKLPHEKEKHINCGIMAQDIEIHMNEAHLVYPNGIQSYTPFEMQPYLIKAIQELSTENQQLKSQLNEMNERLTKLEDKINGNI